MERTLGKLVMDAPFRDAFSRDPMAASQTVEIELTDEERSALARVPRGALTAFQRYLDRKWAGRRDSTLGDDARDHPEARSRAPWPRRDAPDVAAASIVSLTRAVDPHA
jgi:hypothetical protein